MFKLEELYSVAGKVVVVTGGGTGLGKSIAAGFVENGAKVYITGRRAEVLDKAAEEMTANAASGGSVHVLQGDVGTKVGCTKIADAIKAQEGRVDVLINCAGIMGGFKVAAHPDNADEVEQQLLAVSDGDFSDQNAININGVFFLTAALVSLLRKSDDPSVVVISSIAATLNQRSMGSLIARRKRHPRARPHADAQAGTLQLGKLLAGKLVPFKIRVNTVLPGIFPTEMTGVANGSGTDMAAAPVKAVKRSPAGRGGLPHEMVGPIIMLSSKAGGFMNGSVITIDGGRSMGAGINDGIKIPDELLTYV